MGKPTAHNTFTRFSRSFCLGLALVILAKLVSLAIVNSTCLASAPGLPPLPSFLG
jgi:hypothetical protein